MAALLSKSEQEDIFRSRIGLSLDNFSLAWRIADLLIEYAQAGLPPPQATIRLLGAGRSVEIPGTSCGFFTTPVVQMAILDCRRTLEFFGITRDSKSDLLKPITKRQDDDLGIEHFGLALVGPNSCLKPSVQWSRFLRSLFWSQFIVGAINNWRNSRFLTHLSHLRQSGILRRR